MPQHACLRNLRKGQDTGGCWKATDLDRFSKQTVSVTAGVQNTTPLFAQPDGDILLRIDIFVIALQDLIHGAQLQHGMVHGDKDDLLGRNTALKQGLDHLVLYGGLSNPSGPC